MYLSQVHSHASTKDLLQGLETLSRSIDSKSASLKVLVESNFERFVRAKTTIDNVYAEMRNQGAEPENDKNKGHTRVTSRESRHFRNISGQGSRSPGVGLNKPMASDKKKNALTKESEYGVQGIKTPLIEVAVKVEEIWGPALGGREREESLKAIMESVENGEGILKISKSVTDCIKRRDYDGLVEEYGKARKHVEDARQIADKVYKNQQQLTDAQVNQMVITGKVWSDVDNRIEDFKRDVWRRLTNVQMSPQSSISQNDAEEHMPLITILLELGVDDNPIWVWLLSRYDHLKNKINATFERSRVEIEVLRRRLANADPPAPSVLAGYLKHSASNHGDDRATNLDTPSVIELWDLIYDSLNHLLSTRNGILGEVIEFWDKAQSFIDGNIQKTLPIGTDGRSRKHHRLPTDGVKDLQNGVIELVGMLQEYVFAFFADPPIEDVSMLYSPNSPAPVTPQSALSPYAHQDSRFRFDENNPPPPSPKRGEAWEEFAFWPPYANSLSAVHYLERLLTLLGSAASEMAAMGPLASGQTLPDKLKMTVAGARERCLRAACSAWGKDAEACKFLEDWTRMVEHQDLTNMPSHFETFESRILSGMQKILYIPEAANTKSGAIGLVSPPAAKLIQMVRSQFVTSLYKALAGMVENAERSTPLTMTNDISAGSDSVIKTAGGDLGTDSRVSFEELSPSVKAIPLTHNNQNIRHLLTLSNLRLLSSATFPSLTTLFETHFSITLTSEMTQIRDALTQITSRLFNSYTTPTVNALSTIIHNGIASASWAPSASAARPSEVRPYVYEALLLLVYIHTEVSTTTPGGALTNQVLSHLLEQMSETFLSAFKKRNEPLSQTSQSSPASLFHLPALMQATLDMEFVAQTLSQYTTKKASEIQSRIYVELDEKTTKEASQALQGELPEMRGVLKRLREGTRNEFLCFRRERGRGISRVE